MERRGFLKSIAAVSTLAAMPSGIAMTARAGIASATPVVRANLYTWSAMIARTKGAVSPELLIKTLNIDPARAEFLFGRLVSNNVVNMSGTTIINQARTLINSRHTHKVDIPSSEPSTIDDDDVDLELEGARENTPLQVSTADHIKDNQNLTHDDIDTKD